MNYLHWDQKVITDFSEANTALMYEHGYVFTRIGKGVMQQTRSVRIDLSKLELSSENRRILKRTDGLVLDSHKLPLADYHFTIGKMAKDFYDLKFKPGIMSAQKIKEMLTDTTKSNFNKLFTYTNNQKTPLPIQAYAICFENSSLIHYSYPFYGIDNSQKDTGLGMMIRAVEWAKNAGKKYIYLGSLQRPSDTYKLQFQGLEWFDGKSWQTDLDVVKKILTSVKM